MVLEATRLQLCQHHCPEATVLEPPIVTYANVIDPHRRLLIVRRSPPCSLLATTGSNDLVIFQPVDKAILAVPLNLSLQRKSTIQSL